MHILRDSIMKLYGKIKTIESIHKHTGETFNVFSVLNMERREVATHSALIFDLLNPKGSHFQEDIYLDLFIKKVLSINDFDIKKATVKREHATNDNGRIDFVIKSEKYLMAIEMKIDALDGVEQLDRYHKEINNKKTLKQTALLYYLTLDGKDASEISIKEKKDKEGNHKYVSISFAYDILQWIDECIVTSLNKPIIRETLTQYSNLIRKITGQTSQEITMETVKMINNPEIAEAATKMAQNIGYVWAIREAKFWIILYKLLKDSKDISYNWNVDFDKDHVNHSLILEEIAEQINKQRSSKNAKLTGIILLKQNIQIDIYQFNSTGLRYYLSGDNEQKEKIAKIMGLDDKEGKNIYGESKIEIKFYGKYVSEPSYKIFDDKVLNEKVQAVYDEIVGHLKEIDKII